MRVSLALAVHNGSAYLGEQLGSILSGTRRPDEWIIVDDASVDGSADLVAHLLDAEGITPAASLKQAQNVGATRAFVQAIKHSTGDIVLPCDQDDIWTSGKISALEEAFLQDSKLLLAYHDGDIIDGNGRSDGRTIFGTRNHAQLQQGAEREPMDVAANPDVKGCTMGIRGDFARLVLDRAGEAFAPYWGHDHWLALMAWGCGRVHAIPHPHIQHRLHDRNASAGIRFSPWSASQWRHRARAAHSQAENHFVQRYAIALQAIDAIGLPFDPALRDALEKMLAIAERRRGMRHTRILGRLHMARALWREGYYAQHANGAWTLLRDLFA